MGVLMKPIEEYLEEDRIKKEFISGMTDKYDYRLYERFCISKDIEPLSFSMYAMYVDPIVIPDKPVHIEPVKPVTVGCGTCGGGRVL